MTVTLIGERAAGATATACPTSMIERATLILGAFAGSRERLGLEDVVRASGLPRSSAHRILDQLVRQGWLSHNGLGYALGERSLSLAPDRESTERVREAAAPHLLELYLRSGLVVHLAVRDGSMVRYLDKIGGHVAKELPSRVGGRASGPGTALGRAILAWLEPEAVDGLLESADDAASRPGTDRAARLHAELTRIRGRHGIAGDRAPGSARTTSIAVAVCGPDGPIAAISLDAPGGLDPASVAPMLLDVSRVIARELFGRRTAAGRAPLASAM